MNKSLFYCNKINYILSTNAIYLNSNDFLLQLVTIKICIKLMMFRSDIHGIKCD